MTGLYPIFYQNFFTPYNIMRVFLIRHGETEHNREGAITGQTDVDLNQKGVEQAQKLTDRLENEAFDAAYSSDLERTYETTKIVAERQGLHPEQFREFREMDFGGLEGKPKSTWGEKVDNSDIDRHLLRPENGETIQEVGDRFIGKLDELRENRDTEKVLVGGHSVAIKASIMKVLGLEGDEYKKLDLGNTGITELEYDEKYGWKVLRMNDTAHLE